MHVCHMFYGVVGIYQKSVFCSRHTSMRTADVRTEMQTCSRHAACRHADIQTCRHADMQTCRHADIQHTDMQRIQKLFTKNETSVLQLALSRIPCQTGLKQRKAWCHGEIKNIPFRFSPLLPLSTLTTIKLAQVCCMCAGEHVHNNRKYYRQKREDGDAA